MHLPKPPPVLDLDQILMPGLLPKVVGLSPEQDGRYRHWDKLRRLQPPEGLTSEQWWMGIQLARQATRKPTPLLDTQGRPFVLGLPDAALRYLHTIDRDASGALRSVVPERIANPATRDTYLLRSLFEEAISSSQLEGAATTRAVAREMLRTQREPRTRDEQMILNNYEAMRRIRELATSRLTPEVVLELHRITSQKTLDDPSAAGRYRRSSEQIRVETTEGEILHVPPAATELAQRMEAMCAFANGESTEDAFIHPVARAVLIHFWLAYDHPFVDGNGRTARALFYWSMLREGYWLTEFVSISAVIKKGPSRYGRAFLYVENDSNDLTYFLLNQLDVIRRAIDEVHAYIARKGEEAKLTQGLVDAAAAAVINHRQAALLRHAIHHPGRPYSIAGHQHSHNVVYQTARADLLALEGLGLLTRGKAAKPIVFRAPPDLELRLRKVGSEG